MGIFLMLLFGVAVYCGWSLTFLPHVNLDGQLVSFVSLLNWSDPTVTWAAIIGGICAALLLVAVWTLLGIGSTADQNYAIAYNKNKELEKHIASLNEKLASQKAANANKDVVIAALQTVNIRVVGSVPLEAYHMPSAPHEVPAPANSQSTQIAAE
jgi:hypothetical protein